MTNLALIEQAILTRKPIEFQYVRLGKVAGIRAGNPHILFGGTTQEGISRTYVHIVQTGGVSDTLISYPDWRMFIVEYMQDIHILAEEAEFEIHADYNPLAEMYSKTIAKC